MREALVKDETLTTAITLWQEDATMHLVEGRVYRARVLIRNANGNITIGRGTGPGLVVRNNFSCNLGKFRKNGPKV